MQTAATNITRTTHGLKNNLKICIFFLVKLKWPKNTSVYVVFVSFGIACESFASASDIDVRQPNRSVRSCSGIMQL